MARKSYGGDMFSPLRNNELSCSQVLKSSESDCSLELSNLSCDAEKEAKVISFHNKEKLAKKVDESRKNSTKEHNERIMKTSDNVFESGSSHSMTLDDVQLNRISYITTRNKKSHLSENNASEAKEVTSDQSENSKRSKRGKKDGLTKHITLRSETCEKLLKSKTKQRGSFSSTLSSLAEENLGKETFRSESDSKRNVDILSGPLREKLEVPSKVKTGMIKGSSNNITRKSSSEKQEKSVLNSKVEMKRFNSVVDRGVQTDADMFQSASSATTVKKCFACQQINRDKDVSDPQNCNQVQQIQANIIEKLVKDTVSLEFEEVRQLMYLVQLSLLKRLDIISDKLPSSNNAILMKVVEELVEENRRLKQIIHVTQGT